MKIAINNSQKKLKVNPTAIKTLTKWLVNRSRKLNPSRSWHEISVVLMDDSGMLPLNKEYLGSHHDTDVISFAHETPLEHAVSWVGELFLNVECAQRVAGARMSVSKELALYLAHGCDHLSDESDRLPEGKKRMRRRELRWLREAEAEGQPVEKLIS